MAIASEEFLARLRYWLVNGGMITRSACGKTTNLKVCPVVKPSELPLQPDRDSLDASTYDFGDKRSCVHNKPK